MGTGATAGIAIIALVLGFGLGIVYNANFGTSLPFGSLMTPPTPRLSITQVDVSFTSPFLSLCRDLLGDLYRPERQSNIATLDFTLVNSGEEDGFAEVEVKARGDVVFSNRYFVRGDTREPISITIEDLRCSIEEDEIEVGITKVDRG